MTSREHPELTWEERLKAIALQRDKSAFEAAFRHFAPRVKAYLMKEGAPEAEADELAQEVMVTVWRKAEQFDPAKAAASTWIFTIARNRRIDAIRRQRRPTFDPDDPAFVPDPERPADDTLGAAQAAARIRGVIDSLPAEQQVVVRHAFFDEKTHAAIASELDIPLGTVKSRLRLAFSKIRQAMEENG